MAAISQDDRDSKLSEVTEIKTQTIRTSGSTGYSTIVEASISDAAVFYL